MQQAFRKQEQEKIPIHAQEAKGFSFSSNFYEADNGSEDESCFSPSETPHFDFDTSSPSADKQIFFRKRKLETFRKKKNTRSILRSANYDRRGVAMYRPRDESGHFLPARKLQKTELLDLQNQLESTGYENNNLKHSLSERERELEGLKMRIKELEDANSKLQRVESMEQLSTLRSYKQRMSYFHQLEAVLAERRKIAEGLQDPPSGSPQSSIPLTTSDSPISVGSPMTISSPLTQVAAVSAIPSPDVSMASPSSPVPVVPMSPDMTEVTTGPAGGEKAIVGKKSHTEGQRSPRHIRAIPATWFSPDALWNTEILPAFREKIDFSTIQLRHNTIPSNHVELAKVEYWEIQRKFEEQLSKYNFTTHDTEDEGDYNMVGQGKRIISKGHCSPFFSEKIDLKEEISKLKPTPPQVKQMNNADNTFINPTFVTVRNSLHHVTPTSPRPEQFNRSVGRLSSIEDKVDEPKHRDDILVSNHNNNEYPDVQMESVPEERPTSREGAGSLVGQFGNSRRTNDDFTGKIFDIFSQQHPSDWFSIPTPTALLWRAELDTRIEPSTISLSSWFNTDESQRFQLS
eukprot:TRINITY_DN2523_c0_g2_i3.p1 TRINITY_DN2523_c0_g2~~TRINITY_DN2523_c0_g2_i3.p1  ORF type:complete len:573 (-),score=100.32 TRINITY_DN2523_c0_g2_i3:83-1801(-)